MTDSCEYRKRRTTILTLVRDGCRRGWRLAGLAAAVTVLGVTGDGLAQEDQALLQLTRDPKIITLQIRSALAPAERGLQLISTSGDQQTVDAAVISIRDSYRYLRAAYEGSEMALSRASFPDPLMRLRNGRLWQIRLRLLKCVDNGPRLADADGTVRVFCIENLREAIRRLRFEIAALP
jgi:hypothetical protein